MQAMPAPAAGPPGGSAWGILPIALALAAFSSVPVHASGFGIYEQGVAAMANGGAFVARASDPSAVYFNPAGLAALEGFQVMGGTTAILLRNGTFTSEDGARFEQRHGASFPSFLYVTQRVGRRWGWGAGITTPSGIKSEWGSMFPGRFLSRKSSLRVLNFNGNLAAALGRGWSVAAGIDYFRASVGTLSRNIDLGPLGFPGVEALSRLTGAGSAVGWNAAMRRAGEGGWQWGASCRGPVTPRLRGSVEFRDLPDALRFLFPDGPAAAEFPLPAMAATGIALVTPRWEGELDVAWIGWSAFEQLAIDFERNTMAVTDLAQEECWSNSFSVRGGVVRHVTPHHALRCGAYFDRTPVAADHLRPRLPDGNRWSAQVGYGYRAPQGAFADVAYQAILVERRHAVGDPQDAANPVLPGDYSNFVSRFGLAMGWRF